MRETTVGGIHAGWMGEADRLFLKENCVAIGLILQHYEQFDSRYKGLLPLKKAYIPEPLEEEENQ